MHFPILAVIFSCAIYCFVTFNTAVSYSVSAFDGKDTIKNNSYDLSPKEYKLKSGKSFTLIQTYESDYLVNLFITGNGFPDSKDTILFDEIELIEAVVIADIDNDGYEEIYVFTKGFYPGAYDHVFGVASDEDKSYKEINFKDLKPSDAAEGGVFNGYQGQDVYTLEDNSIKRVFPVYKPGDFYGNPSEGYRTLFYTLEKTSGGFFFKLKN
ncbi:MAG: hypothetical protein PHN88_16155 [Ignavibacteria bacterium]|nr:hypothetical protein [Ignavibacteria bacterium]